MPTMNRSEFVVRQLRYYASVGSPHTVYIGDASNNEHRKRIEREIKDLRGKINVCYRAWPKLSSVPTIVKLGELVKEEYCAYCADDDFLVPNSVDICAEFLEKHREYRTAQGKAALFSTGSDEPYGELRHVGAYWKDNEELGNSGKERLNDFSKHYWVPQFSVHRADEFRDDSKFIASCFCNRFSELIHNFVFVCRGRSKRLDCLYLVRQGYKFRGDHPSLQNINNFFDWVTGGEWNRNYNVFEDSVTKVLTECDVISEEEAKVFVKEIFWNYLSYEFSGRMVEEGIKQRFISYLSGGMAIADVVAPLVAPQSRLQKMITKLRIFTGIRYREMSTISLLSQSSPYHEDFMPIYNLVKGKYG